MSPITQINFANLRFLIVDDHAFIRTLIQGMLSTLGSRYFYVAANGDEALRILEQRGNSIDCVISDWNMNPTNGVELLRKIRTSTIKDVSATLCFVMLSGHATSSVVTASANLDVSAYLVKPVSSAKLAAAIEKSMAKSWIAKPVSFYQAVEGIESPAAAAARQSEAAPWVQWIKKGKKVYLEEEMQYIKREGIKLGQAPPASAAEIRNIRHKRVDRVKPGAILVEDVCDADGSIILNAGTILGDGILKRLSTIENDAGEKIRLWVGKRETS